MKKTDKIAGIISIIAIIGLIIYLFKSNLLLTAPKEAIYVVSGLFVFSIIAVVSNYLIIGIILNIRIKKFKNIAEKYSFNHSFVRSWLFIPIGRLNSLSGNILGRKVEVIDECFKPGASELADLVISVSKRAFIGPGFGTLDKSLNMRTKIIIDGHLVTPNYRQKYIFYRDPFMKISDLIKYLETIK